jgi:RHS repeat-associated protein
MTAYFRGAIKQMARAWVPTALRIGLAIALVGLTLPIFGQTPTSPLAMASRGVVPNGSYTLSQIEAVDGVSGNLSLGIPLAALPPGRGGFTENLALNYNSSNFTWVGTQLQPSALWDPFDAGGWRYAFNYALEMEEYDDPGGQPNVNVYRYRMVMPDGSSHVLQVLGYTGLGAYSGESSGFYAYSIPPSTLNPEAQSKTLYSTDGSYLRVSAPSGGGGPWTLYLPDGHIVTGAGVTTNTVSDRNGNSISISRYADPTSGDPITALTDNLGRSITIDYQTVDQDVITQAGYGGQPLTSTVKWGVVTLTGAHVYGEANDCQPYLDCDAVNNAFKVVQSITFANGLVHHFTYDGSVHSDGTKTWGQISSMTLPSGATVAYNYPSQPTPSPAYGAILTQIFPLSSKALTWADEDSSPSVSRQEISTYSFSGANSIFTNPDGGQVKRYFFSPQGFSSQSGFSAANFGSLWGMVYKTETRDASQNLTGTTEHVWNLNPAYGTGNQANVGFHLPGNPVLQLQIQSALNNGSLTVASAKSFAYDRNGNATTTTDTDWTPYANVTHDGNSIPTGLGGATTLRTTTNTFINGPTTSAAGSTDDTNGYWNSRSVQLLNLPARIAVAGLGPGSITEFQYDGGGTLSHGNPTKTATWDSSLGAASNPLTSCAQSTASPTSCNAEAVTHTYDSYGNLTSTTDSLGYVKQLTYDSNSLCVTARSEGSGARNFTYTACDLSTGLTTSETDADHSTTRTFGYDQFGRSNLTTETGGAITRHRTTTYYDSARYVVSRSDLNTSSDAQNSGGLASTTWYDQLGRVRLTQDAAGNYTQSRYYTPPSGQSGFGGSYQLTSNPYSSGSEPSVGWTLTSLDTLGRVISVQNCAQGPTTLPSPWSAAACAGTGTATTAYGAYAGVPNANTVTVSDEANVSRTSYSDGLGRLVQVTENGSENTTYVYDALDNLTGVTQPNSQTRTFGYSSLGRLLSAANPESGLTCYTYDLDGNLHTRTQGGTGASCPVSGGVTVTYGYDRLNQTTSKSYSDSTAGVTYGYAVDWLSTVTAGSVVNRNISFDGLGRVTSSSQSTNGSTWTFPQYQYNLADELTSMTMPSGRVIATTYDGAGRAISLTGTLGTAKTYASSITYAPHGEMLGAQLGNLLWASVTFNSRLQMAAMNLGTSANSSNIWGLANGFSGTNNNGNVVGQSLSAPGMGTLSAVYTYDGMNRLSIAAENPSNASNLVCPDPGSQWCRQYGYYSGGNGNRVVANRTGQGMSAEEPASFGSNNRIADSGWGYDARGNVTQQKTGETFAYDAENRQTFYCASASCTQYFYDGQGRRVETLAPDGTTAVVFVYDAAGNLVAEYGPSSAAALPCTTCYVTADHLGSTRVVTDGSGCAVFRQDYLPFGETIMAATGNPRLSATGGTLCSTNGYLATASPTRLLFTAQAADTESGLDYFGARYFLAAGGRFMSPDAPFNDQSPGDPQSWNLYSYVRNSPVVNVDPDGTCTVQNGQYRNDGGPACPADAATTVTVSAVVDALVYSVAAFATVVNRQVTQNSAHAANMIMDALGKLSGPSCTGALTAVGATAGAGIGAQAGGDIGAVAGGGLGTLALPGGGTIGGGVIGFGVGYGVGGILGYRAGSTLGGLAAGVICSSGTWGGSGGSKGGDYREKTTGANAKDAQNIRDAASKVGVDRNAFGKYVEKMKKLEGRGASENFGFDELIGLTREFKSGSR